jgi:hypothetical protein
LQASAARRLASVGRFATGHAARMFQRRGRHLNDSHAAAARQSCPERRSVPTRSLHPRHHVTITSLVAPSGVTEWTSEHHPLLCVYGLYDSEHSSCRYWYSVISPACLVRGHWRREGDKSPHQPVNVGDLPSGAGSARRARFRHQVFSSVELAEAALAKHLKIKTRRGYHRIAPRVVRCVRLSAALSATF